MMNEEVDFLNIEMRRGASLFLHWEKVNRGSHKRKGVSPGATLPN